MNKTMANNKKTEAGDNDGSNCEENNDRPKQLQLLWRNLKDAVAQIDRDDVLYYCISFISICMLPLSAVGVAAPYYQLSVNIRPVSENIHEDLNCSEFNLTAEELNDSVCSMDTFSTKYSLYHRQVNYFHFTPTFGVSFCEDEDFAYSFFDRWKNNADIGELPEDTEELIGGGNIGNCSHTPMLITAGFATIAMGFTVLGLLWLTVLSSHHDTRKASIVHIVLSTLNMCFSGITIAIFCVLINPLRSDNNPTFCDEQTSFEDCEETLSYGFYCQISTAILSFLVIILYFVKMRLGPSTTTPRKSTPHQHVPFYINPHFFVKLGRFGEFFFAVVSGMINFTYLDLVLPNVDQTQISMSSYLWGDQFCSEKFFALDEFRLIQDDAGISDLKNFGDCKAIYKYKVIFTILKIITSAGASLFLKRDAAKNPFFYLGGLAADVATIILVTMAIAVFMTTIYPGRRGIEPSFCDQYIELKKDFLAMAGIELSDSAEDVCDIRLGPGFYVLCAVLPLTIINLVVEFLAGEIGSEYGAMNAYQTVVKRIKRKEYQDALFGPSSFYRDSILANQNSRRSSVRSSMFSSALESVKEDGADSTPQETREEE